MEDIASTAGLSKGGVYFHFQSKQEVFDALVAEEYDRSMQVLRSVSEMQAPVAEKMQILGKHYLEYFAGSPEAPRFFVVMGEMGLRDENLAKRLLEMQVAYIDQIAKLVEQGIQEGVLRAVDARGVAAMLKALFDGLEGLQAVHYQFDVSQYLTVGLDLLMNGLAKR